jgi:hypothetical protein
VARAQVHHFEPVRLLAVRDDGKTVATPDFVLGGLLRRLDLRLKFCPIALVKLAAERALGYLARHPLPGERQRNLLAQVAPGLLEAPDERPRVEPR